MISPKGERVGLGRNLKARGPVEEWLKNVEDSMKKSLRKAMKKGGQQKNTKFIDVEDFYSDGWRLDEVVEILKNGGVGVVPTDTCYSYVTSLNSRKGVERLLKVKASGKKPFMSQLPRP